MFVALVTKKRVAEIERQLWVALKFQVSVFIHFDTSTRASKVKISKVSRN